MPTITNSGMLLCHLFAFLGAAHSTLGGSSLKTQHLTRTLLRHTRSWGSQGQEATRLALEPQSNVPDSAGLVWERCAKEGYPLVLPSRPNAKRLPVEVVSIRFGSDFNFIERPLGEVVQAGSGPVGFYPLVCGVTAFGTDPAPNVLKLCYCGVTPTDSAKAQPVALSNAPNLVASTARTATTWGRCAVEGKLCTGCVLDEAPPRYGCDRRWVVPDAGALASRSEFSCGSDAFGGKDPAYGHLKECWCHLPLDKAEATSGDGVSFSLGGFVSVPQSPKLQPSMAGPAKVAIVTTTKDPSDLPAWLRYHVRHAGVFHVFLNAEESASLPALIEAQPKDLRDRVTVWISDAIDGESEQRPKDNYDTLQARQMHAMAKAKVMAEKMGIDWLLHIDDDELLYTPFHQPIGEVLGAVPNNFEQVIVPNLEAVYRGPSVKRCFLETTEANTNVHAFAGYYNGKPGIRVSDMNAFPMGPHRWQDSAGVQPLTFELNEQAPFGSGVIILHYESCPFERWEQKFWRLSFTSQEKMKGIPFPFYRDSILRMQQCEPYIKADANGNKKALGKGVPSECGEHAMEQLWARSKTRENKAISKGDVLPIEIPWAQFMTP